MDESARSGRVVARINLEQSKKQAKELVKAHHDGDTRALDQIRWGHPQFRGLNDEQIKAKPFQLADAQLVIARSHHIESWPRLLQHIDSVERQDPDVSRFENAADTIVQGNLALLTSMLDAHPELVRQRSTRSHRSILLHYVSANGVENYRQITPPNILDITRLLLERGSEVDAESNAYGGGSTTLGLAATSAHPRIAGVQLALLDVLIDGGAKIGSFDHNGGIVRSCLANGCPEAAVHLVNRGATLDNLYGAAGLGRIDVMQRLFAGASQKEKEGAMMLAAECDRPAAVLYLLDNGVDIAASDGMTALHWASANGNLALMQQLIDRGASLEALNEYGGTVLSSTLWFAYNARPAEFAARNYPAVFDLLIAAGGRTDFYPDMMSEIEAVRAHDRKVREQAATETNPTTAV